MSLVDFHCHLAAAGGYLALPSGASLFGRQTKIVAVTNRPSEWQQMERAEAPTEVCWALGLHPAVSHGEADLAGLLRAAHAAEAIGEVGLDYSSRSSTPRAEQRRFLTRVLADEHVRRRLVSLHSVQATDDIVALLSEYAVPGAILHWFLGDSRSLERAVDIDVFFSVNEAMLGSERGRRVVESLPPNRVLMETDAPYGGRRNRPNSPGDLGPIIEALSRVWGRDLDATESLIERNQATLIGRLGVVPDALRS